MIDAEPWPAIRSAISESRAIADDLTVAVVANLKPKKELEMDYAGTSVSTEYFSENEASQIIIGFQENGYYTKFYGGEEDFISASLGGEFDHLPRRHKLVYNAAQSGTGPGRKSLVPAFCKLRGISVCNSDAYVVSLARHKFHVYCILRNLGIPTAESWLYDATVGWVMNRRPPEKVRLIAKACFESASIGLTQASVGLLSDEFETHLRSMAQSLLQPMIVQRFITGFEVEAPMIDLGRGPLVLEPVSITLQGRPDLGQRFLDYDLVEIDNYGFAPSRHLASNTLAEIKSAAEATFRALGIGSIGRVDFRISADDGSIAVTDVATSPHLVRHGSFAFAFHHAGLSHADLFAAMVAANARRSGWLR